VGSAHFDSSESHKRRIVLGVSAALLVVLALPVGALLVPVWARRMAERQMEAGAISEAQRWLRWSEWLGLRDVETELMQAAGLRRLGHMTGWNAAMESLRDKGVDLSRLQQERTLGLIRLGAHEVPESFWREPAGAGLQIRDAIEVSVRGHLARREPDKAWKILEFWAAALPQDAHVAYLHGVYWFNQGDEAKALTEFEHALARQPRHELAHTAAARLLEKQARLDEALAAYARFAAASPHRDTAAAGVARILRRLTRIEQARAVAESLASSSEPFSEVWAELGAIELELGNYDQALRWLAQAPAEEGQKRRDLLADAATAFALQEEVVVANRLFEQADADVANEARIAQLLTQLAVTPGRKAAAEELERLFADAAASAAQPTFIGLERSSVIRRDAAALTAAELYALHCSACHGDDGDGNGRAARHQFPRPRDLRTESFRLVSTNNGVPTVEDVERVIRHGMPGTSMRAFDQLSENQLRRLAEEVLRIRREGIRGWYIALLQAEEEEIDEQEVQQVVDLRTLPGDILQAPVIGPADPAAVARGREVYLQSGCRSCHGDDGAGTPEVVAFDPQGLPAWPRDLVHDPFKGGHEPESIGLRIRAGMPGSPHGATKVLTDRECADLVQYCNSLSRQPKRTTTNHQRHLEATQRPLPAATSEANAAK
jgi:mono/diheme cytochrome c family protein